MRGKGSTFLRAMGNNKTLKGLAIVLAVVAWHAIQQTINYEAVLSDVPLTIRVDEGWAVLDRSTDTVDVHFRGPQEDLLELDPDYVEVIVDVRGKAGTTVVTLEPTDVRVPGGAVRAARLRPAQVELTLDREAEKSVPVKADLQGLAPNGYAVSKVQCTPATVTLRGPARRIDSVESVKTRPVSIEDRRTSFKQRAEVLPPGEVWIADLDQDRVTVEVTIEEQEGRREIDNLDVKAMVESGRRVLVDMRPKQVDVLLQGEKGFLNTLDKESIQAYVDCAGLDLGARYELPVNAYVPNGVNVREIVPPTVSVVLEMP